MLLLLTLSIPEQVEKKPVRHNIKIILTRLDLLGFALFAPACIMFLLAMTWGGTTYAWDSSRIIGLFCGSFGTGIVFIVWQIRRGDESMIPPKVIGNQLVLFGCLTGGFQQGALLMLSYYLPLWFQVVKGATPTMSGVMMLPTMISQASGAVVAGRIGT